MRKRLKAILLSITLSTAVLFSNVNYSTDVDGAIKTFDKEVSVDKFQKAVTKGFLGRSYGLGKGQYVCNTYIKAAFEKVANKNLKETEEESFKNLTICTSSSSGAPSSYNWCDYNVKLNYTDSTYNEKTDTAKWRKSTTKVKIRKKSHGTNKKKLEIGDVLTYGKSGGHVALYFGKFKNMDELANRLIELGVYKKGQIKKQSGRYVNKKGKTVIREYPGSGSYWRVHATCSGLMLDNSIVSRSSNGTASFGKWTRSIPIGFDIIDESNLKECEMDLSDCN